MEKPPLLTVTQLTRQVKDCLEASFPYVWVIGEISNCRQAGSGHVYLTLKDETSQLKAIIWRRTAARLKFDLTDGLEVVAAGPLEVYQPRGSMQLIVRELLPQGLGALELAFRQLRDKLEAEGLFAAERKRSLPRFPRRIALVTSPTGAAVRDMLQVLTRRWQAADILLLPVPVQGEAAAEQIAKAIETVPRIPNVDLIITGRGGGSLEDLWPFNEERVARAIFASPIPVVSAVGHEIDVSIADLVADRRALTPSEAGELSVPLQSEVLQALQRGRQELCSALRDRARQARLQLDALASRPIFARPTDRIDELAVSLDELGERMKRAAEKRLSGLRDQLGGLAGSLEALSPLQVLRRGYSITLKTETGEVVRRTEQLQPGALLETRLGSGRVHSRVESLTSETPSNETPSDETANANKNGGPGHLG